MRQIAVRSWINQGEIQFDHDLTAPESRTAVSNVVLCYSPSSSPPREHRGLLLYFFRTRPRAVLLPWRDPFVRVRAVLCARDCPQTAASGGCGRAGFWSREGAAAAGPAIIDLSSNHVTLQLPWVSGSAVHPLKLRSIGASIGRTSQFFLPPDVPRLPQQGGRARGRLASQYAVD